MCDVCKLYVMLIYVYVCRSDICYRFIEICIFVVFTVCLLILVYIVYLYNFDFK